MKEGMAKKVSKGKNNNSACGLKLCTFLCHALQNSNLKSPKFSRSEIRNHDGKLLMLLFGNKHCHVCYDDVEAWLCKRK